MELLYSRCAGLDVHKQTVVACARIVCHGVLRLSDWLTERGCTHVAMEATGVYWKPVWHVLDDGGFKLILANAAHVRNVPGRKTDITDAAWLAELLAHGLIRASFVPDAATEAMRTLMRTRKQLVREKASHTQRLQKTLEDANIKLDSVISDLLGRSGRAMIEALIAGETDPVALAALARRLKATDAKLRAAYVQNIAETGAWARAVAAGRLAVAKGLEFSGEDRMRAHVIERIMCDGAVDLAAAAAAFGADPDWWAGHRAALAALAEDGLLEQCGSVIVLTDTGRRLSRVCAAVFDEFLEASHSRHSAARLERNWLRRPPR
jgi:hypothetical protein